jgi:hypothetical protein
MHVESRKNGALQCGSCGNIIFNIPILNISLSRGRLYKKGDFETLTAHGLEEHQGGYFLKYRY